jgi:F-type H+-transporting ATPase subunit gamma
MAAGQVQALRRRIRTVKSTKKITKAQELVATSRIAKAQERVTASRPYSLAITKVLGALASNASVENPLLAARERVRRAGVLLITSDRGLAGAYNANAIRTAEQLIAQLKSEGKEVALYVVGRKGVGYYRFRGRDIAASWTGFSERPSFADAKKIGDALIEGFAAGSETEGSFGPDGIAGVDEIATMTEQGREVFAVLERAWAAQGIQLVDLKIEFGRAEDGTLVVADMIDNDSWRLWPGGDKGRMLDKQIYRNMQDVTGEGLDLVKRKYEEVAALTELFERA